LSGTWLAALSVALAVLAWGSPSARLAAGLVAPTGRRRLIQPSQRLGMAFGTAVSALLLTAGLGWWALPAAAAIGVASYLVLGRLETSNTVRRNAELVAGLPQVCDLLAVCLEAGLPLRAAVAVVGDAVDEPLRGVLGQIGAQVGLGTDEGAAWADAAAAEPALAGLCREVARSVVSGTTLAKTMRALGADARRESLAAKEVRAKRVGVRSVLPLMVCFLPAFLLLGVVPIIGGVAAHLFG